VFSCRVPGDIVELRRRDRRLADDWRAALRGVFVDAFGSGLRVADVTHDGCYLFHRP
jgi:predicted GNAT superfamily acetyltransferase